MPEIRGLRCGVWCICAQAQTPEPRWASHNLGGCSIPVSPDSAPVVHRLLVIESIMVSPWLLISGPETSVFHSSLSSASSSFWPQPISVSTFGRMMTVILGEVQEGQSRAPGMGKAQHTKKSLACNYCRLKKVKCES